MAVAASARSSAVGPEPRSKAEPTALGAADSEELDSRAVGALRLTHADNALLFFPACLMALAVLLEMGVDPGPPLWPPLWPPVPPWPPALGRHSL